MALKDWTNARDKNEYYNKITSKHIILEKITRGNIIQDEYHFYILKHNIIGFFPPKFKSKSQALRYAKAYMRKH